MFVLVLVTLLATQQPRIELELRPAAAPSWPGASMLVTDAPAKQWFNEGAPIPPPRNLPGHARSSADGAGTGYLRVRVSVLAVCQS